MIALAFAWAVTACASRPAPGAAASPAADGSSERPVELVLPPPIFAADRPGAEPLRVAAAPVRVITGLEGLHVGMAVAEFERLSGPPTSTAPRADEEASWQGAGYRTDREVLFTLPFEEVRTYESPRAPLFKAFVQHDRVVALTFTVYSFEELLKERAFALGDGGACLLGGQEQGIARAFGTPDGIQHDPGASALDVHHYFDRGISVIAEEGRVVTFAIYVPLTAKQRETMRRVLASPQGRAAGGG